MSDDEIYEYLGQTFEWNRVKALKNALNHGVRFTEAVTVFWDPEAMSKCDEEHSESEERYTVVGHSVRSQTLFVVHLVKGQRIRIISARPATPTERRDYEAKLGR
jgi:uncharacterized DUF497 family protein